MPDSKKKVLIVEDDPHIREVYLTKLAQEGFGAEEAFDGEDALNKLKHSKPDVVMLDLMLPGKDGFWLLSQMQSDPTLIDIPVVVLSNLGQDEDRERALKFGVKEYMVKAESPIVRVMNNVKKYLK